MIAQVDTATPILAACIGAIATFLTLIANLIFNSLMQRNHHRWEVLRANIADLESKQAMLSTAVKLKEANLTNATVSALLAEEEFLANWIVSSPHLFDADLIDSVQRVIHSLSTDVDEAPGLKLIRRVRLTEIRGKLIGAVIHEELLRHRDQISHIVDKRGHRAKRVPRALDPNAL
ncbi:MAG: hypothetical protein JSS72_06395 [Armatimonadetes bacterium]|nr:hypothetical protein [Armatimonadota bacterium]